MSKLIVYSAPACVQCRATKMQLEKINADFEVRDAEENKDYLVGLGVGLNLPIVVPEGHDNEAFTGFRPERLKELAARA